MASLGLNELNIYPRIKRSFVITPNFALFNSLHPGRCFNSLPHGICCCNLKLGTFKLISMRDILSDSCKIALRWMLQDLDWCCQHWYRWWLGAFRQKAITWTNVDQVLWHHTASPGYNELNHNTKSILKYQYIFYKLSCRSYYSSCYLITLPFMWF